MHKNVANGAGEIVFKLGDCVRKFYKWEFNKNDIRITPK